MAKCTVGGTRDLPAFPQEKMNALKQVLHQQFSQFWGNPDEFEGVWKASTKALNQSSKAIRKAKLAKM